MYNNSKIAKAIKLAMIFGAGSAATISTTTYAEEAEESIEKIEVTGSRIKRADMETAQPVTVIDRAALEATGMTSVGDFLQSLPMAGSAINTQFNNGGDGSTRMDMRNLGSSRVLVLVNGRRWINSGTGADSSVDLNTIPTTVIKRIEVLKDGAGAVYGSDAIAGVINIITRSDFEGVELTGYYGDSSEGDGNQQQFDLSIGATSDKGHVVFNASYTKQEPVMAGDRDISKEPQFGTGVRLGSSGTPQGRFTFVNGTNAANYQGFFNNTLRQGFPTNGTVPDLASDFVPFTNQTRYNYAPENYMLTPQDRWSVYVAGGYELADDLHLTTEVLYNHRESSQLLAPMPLFIGPWAGGAQALNPTVISADNIYNPFDFDIFGQDHLDYYNGGFIGRRMLENGPRVFEQSVETWKFNVGLDGILTIGDNEFDWSVHFGYGDNRAVQSTHGRLSIPRLGHALSADCNTDSSCVPFNLFGGEGSITDEMLDYVTTMETSQGGNKLWNYAANISGLLFALPAGDVGVATGYEYRREEGYNTPDYMVQSGQSSGGSIQPTAGGFSESSYYMEVSAPLVADVAFAQAIDLSAAIRYTELENSEGDENDNTSTSVGLTWRVNDGLMLRGNFSTGFRAPSVSNLFGGLSTGFPAVNDPCNSDGSGEVVCAGVPVNYTQPNGQLEAQGGANPALEPEESESLSYGLVYEPGFIDGLDFSIDVWEIEIENVISSAGFQQVLDTCSGIINPTADQKEDAAHPIAPNCDYLLSRAPSGVPVDFINPLLNSGLLKTNGADFDVTYKLESEVGDFNFSLDATYTDNYSFTNDEGVEQDNSAGHNFGSAGFPRWKANFNLSWMMDDIAVSYTAQYIGEQEEDCGLAPVDGDTWECSDYNADDGGTNKLDTIIYHDVQASYFLSDYDTRLTLGIQNLLDEEPPIGTQPFANSFDGSLYDGVGRFMYARATVKF